MDAAGRDSTTNCVMSGVDPQGCPMVSFEVHSRKDLDHDTLWRTMRCLPEPGAKPLG